MNHEEFIRKKIDKLRIEKGLSERQLSFDLGHSGNYINAILSGRTLPSMSEFIYICTFFDVSPQDFFQQGLELSQKDIKLTELVLKLDEESKDSLEILLSKISK